MSESVGRPQARTVGRTAAGSAGNDTGAAHGHAAAAAPGPLAEPLARAHRRVAWLVALLLGLGCAGALVSIADMLTGAALIARAVMGTFHLKNQTIQKLGSAFA